MKRPVAFLAACVIAALSFLTMPVAAQTPPASSPDKVALPAATPYAQPEVATDGAAIISPTSNTPPASGVRGVGALLKLQKTRGDRTALRVELLQLDARLAHSRVERDRMKIWGPVTLLVVGYTVGTFYGIGALTGIGRRNDINRQIDQGDYDRINDLNDDDVVDATDLKENRSMTLVFTGIAAVHLGLGALGTWWLVKRKQARTRLDHEIIDLGAQRQLIELELDATVSANGVTAQLGGGF